MGGDAGVGRSPEGGADLTYDHRKSKNGGVHGGEYRVLGGGRQGKDEGGRMKDELEWVRFAPACDGALWHCLADAARRHGGTERARTWSASNAGGIQMGQHDRLPF